MLLFPVSSRLSSTVSFNQLINNFAFFLWFLEIRTIIQLFFVWLDYNYMVPWNAKFIRLLSVNLYLKLFWHLKFWIGSYLVVFLSWFWVITSLYSVFKLVSYTKIHVIISLLRRASSYHWRQICASWILEIAFLY